MTIFSEFNFRESRGPLAKARGLAFEQLVCIHGVTTDLRWAMVELAWRSFTAMCAFGHVHLIRLVRKAHAPQRDEGRGEPCCC
jgi:hypothetical protein